MKLQFILLMFLIFGIYHNCCAQPEIEWERNIAHPAEYIHAPKCWDVICSEDDVVAFGSLYNPRPNSFDFHTFRYNDEGILTDTFSYPIESSQNFERAFRNESGEFLLMGGNYINERINQEESIIHRPGLLLNISEEFEVNWQYSYGEDDVVYQYRAVNLLVIEENYLICGFREHMDDNYENPWIIRIDREGVLIWERTYSIEHANAYHITRIPNGEIVVALQEQLLWINEDGDSLRVTDGGGYAGVHFVDNHLICCLSDEIQCRTMDGELIKRFRENDFPRGFEHQFYDSKLAVGDGLITCGYQAWIDFNHRLNNFLVEVTRFDEDLEILWTLHRTAGFADSYYGGYSIDQAPDGSLYIGGTVLDSFWVAKTTPDPNSVNDLQFNLPKSFGVFPAYPNPFNSTFSLPFTVNSNSFISVNIYDQLGRQLFERQSLFSPGFHTISFDMSQYSSNSYFVQISMGIQSETFPIYLVR